VIEIRKLVKHYKDTEALRGIDLRINRGELFAFLGPNGAGKTTTIRIMTGLTRATSGKVLLGGYDLSREPRAAKKQFGFVPQHINLDGELTVFENLLVHGLLHQMPRSALSQRIEELLDYIDLRNKSGMLIKQLSGGMKRRVMIARALMHSPNMLFLDEPTVGLDPNIRRRIWALIKTIQQEGVTVFLTTHYIEEAEFLAARVAFIDLGNIVAMDTPQNLMEEIGHWAIDEFQSNHMRSFYFKTREHARQWAATHESEFTLRRVNLEDAFLALTGKKVE
jgi:ABC-2 type transport system ATP-binding protein